MTLTRGGVASRAGGGVDVSWTVSRSYRGLAFRVSRRNGDGGFAVVAGAESLATGISGTVFDPSGDARSVYRLDALYRRRGAYAAVPDSAFGASLIAGSDALAFYAYPCRPNPATDGPIDFVFDLPVESKVDVTIFDVSGRIVGKLGAEAMPAGPGRVLRWDGRGIGRRLVPSGHYVYRPEAGPFALTGHLVVAR